jgi:choline-sulfatase
MTRPNILFLMTDQHRWDALGLTGGWVRTPNLDRIAREGVLFSSAYTPSPVCIPARVSLATGWYPHNTAVWDNFHYTMPERTPTWMAAIRAAGYRTSLFGKTHLHPHGGDIREREYLLHAWGLDDVDETVGPRAGVRCLCNMTEEWLGKGLWSAYIQDYAERFSRKPHMVRPSPLGEADYYDTYVGRRAAEYLAQYDRPEPWCCWVSFGGPHEPWDAPEPYASLYDPSAMPPPLEAPEMGEDRPTGRLDGKLRGTPQGVTPDDVAKMRANYAGNVTLIDDRIGEILSVLEEREELENTVIAFTSDHGEMNGDYGLLYKSTMLDSAARVPLLVRTPGTLRAGGGRTHGGPAESLDVGATLAELAGTECAHRQFGRSLCPLLADPAVEARPDALTEIGGEIMLVTDRHKGVLNQEGRVYLLFDRGRDPEERVNLAGRPEMAETEEALRLRILERLASSQLYRPL